MKGVTARAYLEAYGDQNVSHEWKHREFQAKILDSVWQIRSPVLDFVGKPNDVAVASKGVAICMGESGSTILTQR